MILKLFLSSIFNKSLAIGLFGLISLSAQAADKAIIVFDASGSMWGQVDGKPKISIAKKTLGNVVNNWNKDIELGLLAYGHRRKGDCSDIQTLVPVGKLTNKEVIKQVNKISPKGKTPISASIKKAANELKFTEDTATVILISDGKETCQADPCKTAAELEKLGVNFTAHVIGFDVDKETRKQLKCIADNTGGLYFSADNAKELNEALQQVVARPTLFTLIAMDEENGGTLNQTIDWKLINEDTEAVTAIKANGAGHDFIINTAPETGETSGLDKGKWLISGTSGLYAGQSAINLGNESIKLKVPFKLRLPKVTLNAPAEAVAGTEIDINWKAPDVQQARIVLQADDEKPKFYSRHYVLTENKKEATLRLPSAKGNYVLRFMNSKGKPRVLAEKKLLLKAPEIKINAPDEAITGTEIDLSWKAPKLSNARINLELAENKRKFYTNPYVRTQGKKEATMRLPSMPGDYMLRWYNYADNAFVTERPIKLKEATIAINAPEQAIAGSELDISWEAPKTSDARITLELAENKPKFYTNPYVRTQGKKETTMRLPSTPGNYVLRWYNYSDRKLITEKPLRISQPSISIDAPKEALAGSEIKINWSAPKGLNAFINVQVADEKPKYNARPHLNTSNDNSGYLRLPATPGDYKLRWYNKSDRKTVIAEHPIKLTAPTIKLDTPAEAPGGSEIELFWKAPKGLDALINIQKADEKPSFNARPYVYTKGKSSTYMKIPDTPGDYVLRWYNRSDRKVVTENKIKIKPKE